MGRLCVSRAVTSALTAPKIQHASELSIENHRVLGECGWGHDTQTFYVTHHRRIVTQKQQPYLSMLTGSETRGHYNSALLPKGHLENT